MRNAMLRFLALAAAVFILGGTARVQAQGTFSHGTVVALQGTPHLWFADEHGVLHWGGDTRALSGKHVNWNDRRDVSLAELQTYPIGDPWLSAGLLKDGDPIYQVKWESEWPLPKLLHIQSIKDVELFGINGSNYGNFVIDKAAWEQRYGIEAASLERQPLASAVPPGVTLTLAPVPVSPLSDRAALIAFYNATGGATWEHKQNWLSDAPLNLWYGVETDENGRVTKLVLDSGYRWGGNHLFGSLSAALGHLTHLEVLQLDDNGLKGPLPAALGNLTRLKVLSLSGNDLTGPLPVELGNLTNLERLVLNSNRNLGGLLPQSLTGLTRLTEFKFGQTKLCPPPGSAFRTWLQHVVRGTFSLWSGCNVTISPASTPQPRLASDRDVLVEFYNATGGANWGNNKYWLSDEPIGLWWGVQTDENGRVTNLDLIPPGGWFSNNLVGSLPAELGHLTNLEVLRLWDNNLEGPLPAELGLLTSLKHLSLERNNLEGPLPVELGNLTSLEALYLGGNRNLSGPLPPSLIGLTNLERLDIRDTGLCVPADSAFNAWLRGIEQFYGQRGCPAS